MENRGNSQFAVFNGTATPDAVAEALVKGEEKAGDVIAKRQHGFYASIRDAGQWAMLRWTPQQVDTSGNVTDEPEFAAYKPPVHSNLVVGKLNLGPFYE